MELKNEKEREVKGYIRPAATIWKRLILTGTAGLLLVISGIPVAEAEHQRVAPVMGARGMVASAHPLASQVGLKILQDGGNAFDAAVAVAAVLPLVQPGASGLGGAGAALFSVRGSSEVKALSWFGRSPVSPKFAERRKELLDRNSPVSARPPGSLAGLADLLAKHGTMTLKQVLAPAIYYAENGVVVSESMHRSISRSAPRLRLQPPAVEAYLINGEAPAAGSLHRYPFLARTMNLIAEKGIDVVYKGEIAREIVDYMSKIDGLLDYKDLELVSKPTWHKGPLTTTYRGYTLYAVPPVANGVEVLLIMNMLEGFDLKSLPDEKRAHVLAEVLKQSGTDRDTYLGDPAFVKIPVEKLLSKEYARQRRDGIKLDSALPWSLPFGPATGTPESSTTHFVVADEQRNVVSVTNSIGGFGANWHIGRTGLIFSAGVSGMSQNPKHPNYAVPGKYQQMTMGPVLVFNSAGRPVLALGAAGGHRISQAIAQVIVNFVDMGLNVQAALDAPRVSYGGPGANLTVSSHFSKETFESLKKLGHTVQPGDSATVQAIAINPATGTLAGGADRSAEGKAAGY